MQPSAQTQPTPTRQYRSGRQVLLIVAGLLALLIWYMAARPVSTPGATPTPAPQRAQEQPFTFSGTSGTQTQPFALAGGAYDIQWQASPGSRSSAYCGVELADMAGSGKTELLVNEGITSTKAGRSSVYSVAAGQHYLKVTDCGTWSVTISSQ